MLVVLTRRMLLASQEASNIALTRIMPPLAHCLARCRSCIDLAYILGLPWRWRKLCGTAYTADPVHRLHMASQGTPPGRTGAQPHSETCRHVDPAWQQAPVPPTQASSPGLPLRQGCRGLGCTPGSCTGAQGMPPARVEAQITAHHIMSHHIMSQQITPHYTTP